MNSVTSDHRETSENGKAHNVTITGMHCAGCVASVERAIASVEGVRSVHVNLATGTARVEALHGREVKSAVESAVRQAGYGVGQEKESSEDRLAEKRERDHMALVAAKRRAVGAWVVTLPIMIWMALEMLAGIHLADHLTMETVTGLAAAWVLFFPGRETLMSAWRSARALRANMDLLIGIGTVASLLTAPPAILHALDVIHFPMHSFAGIAAMIMAFHLLGRYIETRSRGRASEAILRLLTLQAVTARVIRDGEEVEIPLQELAAGDLVRVRPGETVPADGVVREGEGSVDESMITGESMPVRKEAGAEVIGGTVNLEGSLRVEVTGVGEQTFLSRVIRLVEEAQGTKVPIQAYADRVTALFVPVVLLLAALTFLAWALFPALFEPVLLWAEPFLPWVEPEMGRWSGAFYAMLAVLVIACPCALGLATPVALMVGAGLGASNGILIRRADAIQTMNRVDTMVFDKTGTLTMGEPVVSDLELLEEVDRRRLLSLVRAAEEPSEHPVSRALVELAGREGVERIESTEFVSRPGLGVRANVDGTQVLAGNRLLMERENVGLEPSTLRRAETFEREGKTVIFIAVDGLVTALAALSDRIKPGARETVERLGSEGLRVVMMSGDHPDAARAIAGRIGIEEVHAGVLPDRKSDLIGELQAAGAVVAMVGDGVNDAPALSRADVGIAIGTGTDIAIESGSIILVDGDPAGVVRALRLSRETFRKIRQNLFWAWFYNVVMIPVAMAGLLHPVLAEAAMAFSSINVVGNSRRLPSRLPDFKS